MKQVASAANQKQQPTKCGGAARGGTAVVLPPPVAGEAQMKTLLGLEGSMLQGAHWNLRLRIALCPPQPSYTVHGQPSSGPQRLHSASAAVTGPLVQSLG